MVMIEPEDNKKTVYILEGHFQKFEIENKNGPCRNLFFYDKMLNNSPETKETKAKKDEK